MSNFMERLMRIEGDGPEGEDGKGETDPPPAEGGEEAGSEDISPAKTTDQPKSKGPPPPPPSEKPSAMREAGGGERKVWWRVVVYVMTAISFSFFVLALLSCFFQYAPKFNRIHTIDTTNEAPRDDTETRYTAAFLLSGPLQPVVMFFAGAVMAYWPARAANSEREMGYVSTWELIVFNVLWLLVFFWMVWPGFWYADSQLRGKAEDLHSSVNNDVDWPDEDEIPYLEAYFTSPLASYVLSVNVYMIFASLAQLIMVWTAWGTQRATGYAGTRSGDDAVPFASASAVPKSTSRTIVIALLQVMTGLMIAAFLSHLILTALTVLTDVIGDDEQTYWMTFTTSVHLSLAFFFAGWLTFFFVTGTWWSNPAATKREFFVSKLTAFITFVVGVFVVVFGVLFIVDTDARCIDTIQNDLEGDTELKITVCELQAQERVEYTGVWHCYIIVSGIMIGAAGAATLLAAVSFFFPPNDAEGAKRFKFTPQQSAFYAKDSGSDTGSDTSYVRFADAMSAIDRRANSTTRRDGGGGGNFFEKVHD